MKSNKNFRKDDLSPESNTKKIYKMYKRKKQWVVAPVVFGLLFNALSPVAALAVTDTEQAGAETAQTRVVVDPEELKTLKENANTAVGKLTELNANDKAEHYKAITDAKTPAEVATALTNAYIADVDKKISTETEEYTKKIDALDQLSETSKAQYKLNIFGALDLVSLGNTFKGAIVGGSVADYGNVRSIFDSQLAKNKVKADEEVQKAIDENTAIANLPAYRAQQKALVNGLAHITAIEKEDWIVQIEDAKTKDAVDQVMDTLNTTYQGILNGLIDKQANDLITMMTEAGLSEKVVESFVSRIDAITNKEDKSDKDLEELKNIKTDLDRAIADKEVVNLQEKKTDVKAEISKEATDLGIKSEDVKKFHNKVDAAATSEAVDAVKKEWDAFYELEAIKKQDHETSKKTAEGVILALDLDDKSVEQTYINDLKTTSTAAEVAAIVSKAQDAKKKEIKALADEKAKAVKEVQALPNLKKPAKDDHIVAINAAKTISEVKAALKAAKDDDKATALENAKIDAKNKISGLSTLDELAKSGYKADVNLATTIAEVEAILAKAVLANDLAAVKAADLAEAKTLAKDAVKKLTDLTSDQMTAAINSINGAKNQDAVEKALKKAADLNARNKEIKDEAKALADEKASAIAKIDAMKYLSKSMKDKYKSEVNSKNSISDVQAVVAKAKQDDDELKMGQDDINNAKTDLVEHINGLNELTAAEKKQFGTQAINCSTIDEIETLKIKVDQLVADRKLAATNDLADAKNVAKLAIDDLGWGLTQKQIDAYKIEVDKKDSKADVVTVYEKAKAEAVRTFDNERIVNINKYIASDSFVQAQKEIDQLKSDSTRKQYQTKLNNAIALSQAKADANKQIDALENTTAEQKAAAKEKISKLTTKAEVEKELEALVKADNLIHDKPLVELAEAQIKAKDFDKAAETIGKIRDADTKAKLQKQLADAQKVAPAVKGTGHVSKKGWQKTVDATTDIVGTTGQKLALEAVKLNLADVEMPKSAKKVDGGIEYRAHVRNIGWQGYNANGALAGTTGRSLQMEAIQIRLTGELAKRYNVEYRAHSKDKGWSKYVSNGATAGTTGKSLRMEAVQIRLVEKK